MKQVLWINPVFQEKIWGGRKLADVFDYSLESNKTGECWAISAHPNGESTIIGGEYDGWSLRKLWSEHRELFGDIEGEEFPLLIKLIDANEDLSVQVHPNDDYASKHHQSLGKTECWYVLDVEEDTKMVMGHHAKTKEELVEAIRNDDYDSLLNAFKIKKGDFFYIPSGTIHAICAGSLIYEAQQSSDITYRVYDYHRKDDQGNERELHVTQSIDVTQVPHIHQEQVFKQETFDNALKTTYVSNEFFSVSKFEINGAYTLENDKPFLLVSVVEGSGIIDGKEVNKGVHFVVPSSLNKVQIDGCFTLMVCSL